MENIQNSCAWVKNPLRVRCTGTAEYVFNFLCNFVQHEADAEYDHEQDIRNDYSDEELRND